jgi:hypothetical protein
MQRRGELALVLPKIDLREMIFDPFLVLIRKIVMPIDERHLGEDAIDPRGDGVGLGEGGKGKKKEESDSGRTMHAADCSSEGRGIARGGALRQCSPALGAGAWSLAIARREELGSSAKPA